MKILCINCRPDFSYFTKREVKLEVEYKTISELFPLKYLYDVKDQSGAMVHLFTPNCAEYLERNYPRYEYSAIYVGWQPKDYSPVLKNTGGYTCPFKLKSGTRWITVRQDTIPVNTYPLHETMHLLTSIINMDFGIHQPIDYMDTDRQGRPYYLNEQPENPASNFAQTWVGIQPYLDRLNALKYAETAPQAVLTRLYDYGRETVGRLEVWE